MKKIFWHAEYKVKHLLEKAGSNVKCVAVNDCCREPFEPLKLRIVEALKIAFPDLQPVQSSAEKSQMENISAEECSFYKDLFGSKRKGAQKPTKNLINYLAVYGNTAG